MFNIKKLLNLKFKKGLSFSYITQAIIGSFGFLQLFLINKYFGVETFVQLAIIMLTTGVLSALLLIYYQDDLFNIIGSWLKLKGWIAIPLTMFWWYVIIKKKNTEYQVKIN